MPNNIQKDIPLASETTLGVGGNAEFYVEVFDVSTLESVIAWAKENEQPITVLGGGSNVLVSDEGIKGLVIHMSITGSEIVENESEVLITVGAGEDFDKFVSGAVSKNYWGLENLSGIPGSVGATPIQNVGAYGVEVAELIDHVEVFDLEESAVTKLENSACNFEYRNSLFKKNEGKRYIVTRVTFRLSKEPNPKITYKDLKNYFEGNSSPSLQEIRDAVLTIRSKKFPDWTVEGTAGSFFKNPVVSKDIFKNLQQKYPDIPGYLTKSGDVKVSLGWILDKVCNLKGYTKGNVGLYKNQALVLVCKKGIKSTEIENFAHEIVEKVFEETGIRIEMEVTHI